MEACATAHYWGRELSRLGHEVRLIPPIYVKPFVKRQKNDAADAEAVAEAAQRPTMRTVAVKTADQQARAMLFRTRDLLVGQRTRLVNALRGHLAEHGIIIGQGVGNIARFVACLDQDTLPELVRDLGRLYSIRLLRSATRSTNSISVSQLQPGKTAQHAGCRPCRESARSAPWRSHPFAPAMREFHRGRDFAGVAWARSTAALLPVASRSLVATSKMGQRDIRRLLIEVAPGFRTGR